MGAQMVAQRQWGAQVVAQQQREEAVVLDGLLAVEQMRVQRWAILLGRSYPL